MSTQEYITLLLYLCGICTHSLAGKLSIMFVFVIQLCFFVHEMSIYSFAFATLFLYIIGACEVVSFEAQNNKREHPLFCTLQELVFCSGGSVCHQI